MAKLRKDRSRDNGGISEADKVYSEGLSAPSNVETALDTFGDILSMGSVSKMKKAHEKRERDEFVDKYNKEHDIEPESRHKEYR